MIKWKYQTIILEIKVISLDHSYHYTKNQALEQTVEYANLCGVKEAHLLIFDKNKSQKWEIDEPNEIEEYDGVKIEIWKLR